MILARLTQNLKTTFVTIARDIRQEINVYPGYTFFHPAKASSLVKTLTNYTRALRSRVLVDEEKPSGSGTERTNVEVLYAFSCGHLGFSWGIDSDHFYRRPGTPCVAKWRILLTSATAMLKLLKLRVWPNRRRRPTSNQVASWPRRPLSYVYVQTIVDLHGFL